MNKNIEAETTGVSWSGDGNFLSVNGTAIETRHSLKGATGRLVRTKVGPWTVASLLDLAIKYNPDELIKAIRGNNGIAGHHRDEELRQRLLMRQIADLIENKDQISGRP